MTIVGPRALILGWRVALMIGAAAATGAPAEAQQRPNLQPALLTVSDLPSGWRPVEDGFDDLGLGDLAMLDPSDFDLGDLGIDPNGPCARLLVRFGEVVLAPPLAQAQTAFQRGELGPFLLHSVLLLPPGAAPRYLALSEASFLQSLLDTCIPEFFAALAEDDEFGIAMALQDLGLSFRVSPLKLPQIGDQTVGVRMDITAGVIGTSLLIVNTRRGDAVSTVVLLTDPLSANTSDTLLEALARRADTKLMGALAGR